MSNERVIGTLKILVPVTVLGVLLYFLWPFGSSESDVSPVAETENVVPQETGERPAGPGDDAAAGEPEPMPEVATDIESAPPPAKASDDPGEEYYRMGLYPEALAYWKAQADAGNAHAAYRYAVEFHDAKPNVVAERDLDVARTYYEQAAGAGHARAQYDLGSMYEFGTGVPQSIEKAAEFYHKAALGGVPEAQWNYATMLETGEGVEKDEIQALAFYLLAGDGGFSVPPVDESGKVDPEALTAPEELAERLTPEQVVEARQRAIDFVPEERPN